MSEKDNAVSNLLDEIISSVIGAEPSAEPNIADNSGYQIYRAISNNSEDSNKIQPLSKTPPSYSAVMKMEPQSQSQLVIESPSTTPSGISIHPSIPFITRQPPPSYSEVLGIFEDSFSIVSSTDTLVLGPDPLYTICPRCSAIIITQTYSRRSVYTYLSSLFMFLCLCWPCCLFPLCSTSCNDTYHSCPYCSYYFGMYRPW